MAFLEVAQAAGIKAWKSTSNYAEAERAISRYLAALSLSDHNALDGMRDPVWSRRKLNGGDRLHFAENAVSIDSAREPLDWADGVWLTSLQIFRDGMAVARFDDWEHDKAALMLLFCVRGKWRVASEISATAEHGDNSATRGSMPKIRTAFAAMSVISASSSAVGLGFTWVSQTK